MVVPIYLALMFLFSCVIVFCCAGCLFAHWVKVKHKACCRCCLLAGSVVLTGYISWRIMRQIIRRQDT